MACSGHHVRLKECNLTGTLSVFFGLCLLSIDILPGSKWLHLQNFFGVRLCEKAWEISCQLVRAWDRLWNGETHGKVVRLHVKSGEKVPLAIIFVIPNILVIPFTKVKRVHFTFMALIFGFDFKTKYKPGTCKLGSKKNEAFFWHRRGLQEIDKIHWKVHVLFLPS